MFLLSDIITYIRRIIKSPSDSDISDGLIIDYINRFWITDVDARLQIFDLKKKYQFQTQPGVDKYNMPLYDVQIESPGNNPQSINFYPVYQGFLSSCFINGVGVPLQTQKNIFFNAYPNVIQNFQALIQGDGTGGPYFIQIPLLGPPPSPPPPFPNPPINSIIRGHVNMEGVIATGNNVDPPVGPNFQTTIPVSSVESAVTISTLGGNGANVLVTDSGQFLDTNINCGLLMQPGKAPFGNQALAGGYSATSNIVNYLTGEIYVTFPALIPAGNNINVQVLFFQSGLPRTMLFYDNTITMRTVPDKQYTVELDAYLSPAAFLTSNDAVQFGYMSEYIARGAARKILSDTGDIEQFQFYEPLFIEQERLVWKRSQRQWTATRTETLYSQGFAHGGTAFNNFGGSI